MHHIFLF